MKEYSSLYEAISKHYYIDNKISLGKMSCNFLLCQSRDILLPTTFTCVPLFNFVFIWRHRKLNSEVDWMCNCLFVNSVLAVGYFYAY